MLDTECAETLRGRRAAAQALIVQARNYLEWQVRVESRF